MMAGYNYPKVGDPDDDLNKPSLLEVAAGSRSSMAPIPESNTSAVIESPGNVGGVTTTSSNPGGYGGGVDPGGDMSPASGIIPPDDAPPLGEELIGGLGPQNPQPLPEGSGPPQNIPTNAEEVTYTTTPMYEQQQPAETNLSDAWTYEQTWIDPIIKENLLQRDPVQLQSTMADIAAGQMSPVIQQQRERAMQSALATAASARGMPTSATQRMMTQQMSEADRSAMEAAAQQQLQAGQQVDEMAVEDARINAQLEQQRDSMLDSLIGRGVDRNVALAQVNAELDRMKEELAYKYWAGRLGSTTEVLKQAVENSDFLEGGVESVAELGPVINMLMGFGMPEGYGVPTTRILSDYTDDPQGIFTETTTGGTPGMDEMIWNHETQSWEMQQGAPGVRQSLGVQDFAGQQVEVWRTWNEDKMIYEYSFTEPYGGPTAPGQTGGGGATPPEEPDYPEGGAPL